VIGLIPAYDVLDISSAYSKGRFRFEFGVNNILNEAYFTRRATGYPGPGIIPSPNRNFYLTVQFKL
jgi:Fe(3+) dicitrate transport protein